MAVKFDKILGELRENDLSGEISIGDDGEIILGSGVVLGEAITAPTLVANTDNLLVPDIQTAIMLRVISTGNYSLTGVVPANDTKAWMLFITNVGANNITLKNNDAGSLSTNRFLVGGNKTLQTDEGILLYYDPISKRWRGAGIII